MRRRWRRRRATRAGRVVELGGGRAGRGGGHEVKVYLGAHLARSEGRPHHVGSLTSPLLPHMQPSTCRLNPPPFTLVPCPFLPFVSLPPALSLSQILASPAPRRPALLPLARRGEGSQGNPTRVRSATRGFLAQDFARFSALSFLGGFPTLLSSVSLSPFLHFMIIFVRGCSTFLFF